MADELDKPTAELSLDKDQVDALLIILTQDLEFRQFKVKNIQTSKHDAINSIRIHLNCSEELAIKTIDEQIALDQSLLITIPGILTELKELYPYLQERTKKSQIVIPKPSWKRQN